MNTRHRWMEKVANLRAARATPDEYHAAWLDCLDTQHQALAAARHNGATPHLVPMWWPDEDTVAATNLSHFMQTGGWSHYDGLHDYSTRQAGPFWHEVAQALPIVFQQAPTTGLAPDSDPRRAEWFPGSPLNIADSCLQVSDDAPAAVIGRVDGTRQHYSRHDLLLAVRRVAAGLRRTGFGPGDRLAVVMPMTWEAVVFYLAAVFAGCPVISIADSFAPAEIERRLRIANANGVCCVAAYTRGNKTIRLYDRVLEAHAPRAIVIDAETSSLRSKDVAWETLLGDEELSTSVPAPPAELVNVLFSSGTTGDPKAIPWTHATPIKCIADGYFHHDIHPGDVIVWPTNLGWMMGPWLIFASLANHATIGLFEDVSQMAAFGRFIQDARVTMLGVVPTLVRQWRAARVMEAFDWSHLRCFSSTGEASNADDMFYLSALAGMKPVIEYCGGTEIGGGYITSSLLHPNVPAAFSCPAIGNRFVILDEEHAPADQGELFLIPPALGLSTTLLNRDHDAAYYQDCPVGPHGETLRRHGDFFRRTPGEYYVAGGRVDDTMNLGGIKVSSAEIERTLNRLEGIRETAAVAVTSREPGPDTLVMHVVLDTASTQRDPDHWREQFNKVLKHDLNPLFHVASVTIVDQLPRTASNKVMRRLLRSS